MVRMEEFKGPNAAFLPAKTFKDTMSLFSGKDRMTSAISAPATRTATR